MARIHYNFMNYQTDPLVFNYACGRNSCCAQYGSQIITILIQLVYSCITYYDYSEVNKGYVQWYPFYVCLAIHVSQSFNNNICSLKLIRCDMGGRIIYKPDSSNIPCYMYYSIYNISHNMIKIISLIIRLIYITQDRATRFSSVMFIKT